MKKIILTIIVLLLTIINIFLFKSNWKNAQERQINNHIDIAQEEKKVNE